MLVRTALANINQQRLRLAQTQEQATSGLRINRPSDDPVAARLAMQYRRAQAATEQFYKDEVENVKKIAVEKYNQSDAPERVDAIVALVDKWTEAFDGVDKKDVDAVAKVYYDLLWSKVDVSKL